MPHVPIDRIEPDKAVAWLRDCAQMFRRRERDSQEERAAWSNGQNAEIAEAIARLLEELRSALAAREPETAATSKTVSGDVTQRMMVAGVRASTPPRVVKPTEAADIYRAMLDAAPEPPADASTRAGDAAGEE